MVLRPGPIAGSYRCRERRVAVGRCRDGRWRVLDIAGSATVVETLSAPEDRVAEAHALARDYAAEQLAFGLGLRGDPLPRPQTSGAAATAARAA